ncbi:BlaR1 family beta-lactam sensor/signal transducer [Blautia schinkii]|nr:BlaR1 family beta-lactam sensor/signal transducer [Blautia schinkii]
MADFMIRFLICNVFLSFIIGFLLILKRIFKNTLSSRMQYHLWFLMLGLLAVPFLPFRLTGFSQILSWITSLHSAPLPDAGLTMSEGPSGALNGNANWINDFTLSVNSRMPSAAGSTLFGIWFVGILAMLILVIKSSLRLRRIRQSALPLQNTKVRRLYRQCLKELDITRKIPIYSTAFLKSPIIVGFLKPCIYLPIHLISDYKESDMRYMLLHELQHYKHKDALTSYLMNIAGVIYWFNPIVWYALREMRNDREIACDTSVLNMLKNDAYQDYGITLINFAKKVSLTPFPFFAGLSGNMKQMKRRIINIASYERPTFRKKLKSMSAFMLTAVLLFGLAPILSVSAAEVSRYQWKSSSENISNVDLSAYFGKYEGSFVLYSLKDDKWSIHDMEHATLRSAPNSTYKIYNALFGLEEGIITPRNSFLSWNGEVYPFEAWNVDQTLQSAMHSSVNWYFQTIDTVLGADAVSNYIQKIGYGNKDISGGLSHYWLESSLKISPVEQVKLLTKLYTNEFLFDTENINAVKDSILLFSSEAGTLYGKTGTGCVDGQDVNGWFVGYIETNGNTYFFATNINADKDAAGSNASEITLSILSDLNIWE